MVEVSRSFTYVQLYVTISIYLETLFPISIKGFAEVRSYFLFDARKVAGSAGRKHTFVNKSITVIIFAIAGLWLR